MSFLLVPLALCMSLNAQGPRRTDAPPERETVTKARIAALLSKGREVLVTERREDAKERDRLVLALSKLRVNVRWSGATPDRVARDLAAHVGDACAFFVRSRDGARDWESVDLQLDKRPLVQALSVIAAVSKIRFVFRSGVVLVVHEADVRPELFLETYDLRMLTRKVRDYPAPEVGVPTDREPQVEDTEERTASGFDADRFEELLRSSVLKDSWDNGATILRSGGIFFVRQTARSGAYCGSSRIERRRRRKRDIRAGHACPAWPPLAPVPHEVVREVEFAACAVRTHVANLAEDRALGAPRAVVAAEDPEDARVGVGVATVDG
ncbi:MAG: hypothetical protein KDC95_22650, partial [Planctomycetes bacterium]|nr:hypothetical protein [Planctomycetota bacterium]